MDPRTARTELDRATGRTATRSARRRERRRGAPVAAAALIAGLAGAWLFVSARNSGSVAAPPAVAAPAAVSLPPTTTVAADTAALRVALHAPATCTDVGGTAEPEIACSIAGVRVDARLVGAASVQSAYASAAGRPSPPGAGPSACAGGQPDERAWSRPATPSVAVGRYRCRIEDGVAAMWWTDGAVLVHATATTPDLAALFDWWRAHLEG